MLHLQLEQLPYPVAYHLARSENPRLPYLTRFGCLLDGYKALIKLLALSTISDYVASGAHDEELERRLRVHFLSDRLSLGHWSELLRETVRYFAIRATRPPFLQEIVGFYFRDGRLTPAAARLELVVSVRNQELGHAVAMPSEDDAARLYTKQRAVFTQILADLTFLDDYDVVIPEELNVSGPLTHVVSAYICRGPSMSVAPNLGEPFNLSIPVVRGESLLLARRTRRSEHILLYPLLLPDYRVEEDLYDLYSYEGSLRARHDRLSISRLLYHGTRVRQQVEVDRRSQLGGAFEQFVALYAQLLGQVLGERDARATSLRSHYFAAQRGLIDSVARTFVGRVSLLARVDALLRNAPSGYFVVEGAPGAGKTALLARLTQQHDAIHHFFARDGGRDRHLLALRSLLQQLIDRYQLPFSVPEELAEVEKTYQDAWQWLSELRLADVARKPELLVIDALDESDLLDTPDRVGVLLPGVLPLGFFVVISSRPGSLLGWVTFSADVTSVEVEPFSREEIAKLAAARGLSSDAKLIHAVWEATDGNPLFVRLQIDELLNGASAGGDAARQLRLRVEDCFEARLERMGREVGTQLVLDVVGLLANAQAALSVSELARLLPLVPLFTLRRTVAALKEFLIEDEGRFRLFHKRFDDYVRQGLFTAEQIASYHRKFIECFEPWREKRSSYGFRFLSSHYLAAAPSELVGLLTPEFWRARFDAEGASADLFFDATRWIEAGFPAQELLARLASLVSSRDVLMTRSVIRCIADLRHLIEPERLASELTQLPTSGDFWIGAESRKAIAQLRQAHGTHRSAGALRIGVLNYIGHLPFFFAREAGLYELAGLDVQLLFFDGYEQRLRALIEGEVDGLASTLDEVFLAVQAGVHLQPVLRLSQETEDGGMVDGILVRAPVTSVRELAGSRIAVEKDSPSVLVLHHALQKVGLKPSDVELIYFRSSDDAGAALRDRRLDAAVLWEPWLHQAKTESGCHVLPIPCSDIVEDVLTFRAEVIAAFPEAIARLQQLWCNVVDSSSDQDEAMVKLAREQFGLESEAYHDVSAKLSYAGVSANRDFFSSEGGSNVYTQLSLTQDVLWNAGVLQSRIDLKGLVPHDALKRAPWAPSD